MDADLREQEVSATAQYPAEYSQDLRRSDQAIKDRLADVLARLAKIERLLKASR